MKIRRPAVPLGGYALIMVMALSSVAMLALAGVMAWTNTHARNAERGSQFNRTQLAAEAVAERVIARIARDFQTNGYEEVNNRLADYRQMVPSASESPVWKDFEVIDPETGFQGVSVNRSTPWEYTEMRTRYRTLRGFGSTFRVATQARELGSRADFPSAVQQDVQLASIPIHHFGVFYAVDLEIGLGGPGQFRLTDRVHSNSNVYLRSSRPLTFDGHLTASKRIVTNSHPNDPVYYDSGPVTYRGEADSKVNTMTLPLGGPNTLALLRSIVEVPPPGEPTNSPLGRMRSYNQADLIIRVGDSNVVTTSGAYNGFAVSLPWSEVGIFVSTNNSFFDRRESRQVQAVELDVQVLNARLAYLRSVLGRSPRMIYIIDERTTDLVSMGAIRIVKAKSLPAGGLTVATPNPLYLWGDFNSPDTSGGTGGSMPEPAALICDAITVLSENWVDALSTQPILFRLATSTKVNACIITGITPSSGGYYSGGLENAKRLLEFWWGSTLTFRGSVAVLYYSQQARGPWGTWDVYYPPTRNFTFDSLQMQGGRRPAGIPEVRTMFRDQWQVASPMPSRTSS